MGNAVIRVDRAKRIVGLLGEAHEIGLGTETARRHIATTLLDVVGGVSCLVVRDSAYHLLGRGGLSGKTGVNVTREIGEICGALEQRGCALNPVHFALMQRNPHPQRKQILSATDQAISRRDWTESEFFNEYIRPAGVDRYLTSMRHDGEHAIQAFGVVRAAGDGPFSEEDRHALHLLHVGLGPVFSPEPESVYLAPRVRRALEVLLTGAADKEIAARLEISVYTAKQYVKAILKAYGVSSRSQLIARLAGSSVARGSTKPGSDRSA